MNIQMTFVCGDSRHWLFFANLKSLGVVWRTLAMDHTISDIEVLQLADGENAARYLTIEEAV